jgi:hypothetical protein
MLTRWAAARHPYLCRHGLIPYMVSPSSLSFVTFFFVIRCKFIVVKRPLWKNDTRTAIYLVPFYLNKAIVLQLKTGRTSCLKSAQICYVLLINLLFFCSLICSLLLLICSFLLMS